MSALVDELKTRARVRLNTARREGAGGDDKLRDLLHAVAREAGFAHWEHARRVLGGLAQPDEDMGTFWHAPRTSTLLNEWHATPAAAQAARAGRGGLFLLPYKRQAVLVGEVFIEELGLDPAHPAWNAAGRDLVAAYGSPAWRELAALRLRAPRSSFA
jgi:hypothetical protein